MDSGSSINLLINPNLFEDITTKEDPTNIQASGNRFQVANMGLLSKVLAHLPLLAHRYYFHLNGQ